MRLASALAVGLSFLACATGESPPPPAPVTPAPASPVPVEDGVRLLPPLPDRGVDRPADCLLVLEELEPALRMRQPGARAPAQLERREGAVVVTMDDGTVVRLARSGCAHYGETWEIAPVPPGKDPREAAVERLGVLVAPSGDAPQIVGILKRATGIGEDGSFRCGDAMCGIRADGQVVTVEYDFPL